MSVINTNITSMIGQSNLSKSQGALQTSMERLSSGLRINSAKDDAAGQAIANRMTAQITGLAQAQRNANDGISIAQTAEGSLNQINDNLQRIRELTVQAQNGTNSASDIDSIQQEVNERLSEIDRIARETDFNGTKVLDNDADTSISIQVGADDGQTIDIEISQQGGWNLFQNDETAAADLAEVGGEARKVEAKGFDVRSVAPLDVEIDEADLTAITAGLDSDAFSEGVELRSYTGENDETLFAITGNDGETPPTNSAISVTIDADGNITAGSELTEAETTTAVAGTAVTFAAGAATVQLEQSNALDTLDTALAAVDGQRSLLGAIQNRFEDAITNLNTNETNLAEARSRIEDADYAVEVANMTRAQILQQAGTSVLAQANQIPQNVLSLLG